MIDHIPERFIRRARKANSAATGKPPPDLGSGVWVCLCRHVVSVLIPVLPVSAPLDAALQGWLKNGADL